MYICSIGVLSIPLIFVWPFIEISFFLSLSGGGQLNYSVTCLNETLSKQKTCLNQTLSKQKTCLSQTLSKQKACLTQTDFTVSSTKCLCNLNLYLSKMNKFFSPKGVRFRQVLLYMYIYSNGVLRIPLIFVWTFIEIGFFFHCLDEEDNCQLTNQQKLLSLRQFSNHLKDISFSIGSNWLLLMFYIK